MHRSAIIAASLLTVMVTACGSAEEPEVVEQIIVREPGEPEVAATPTGADGEINPVALGKDAFQMCAGCHVNEAGAPSTAGPNLYGVMGRVAGGVEGYPYSDALLASDITWDEASMDGYLADPAGFLPGTDMLAGAVPDPDTRSAIIAYLASTSE
jgi:cytochrome c